MFQYSCKRKNEILMQMSLTTSFIKRHIYNSNGCTNKK